MGEVQHNHHCSCCSGHCHAEESEKNELFSMLLGLSVFIIAFIITELLNFTLWIDFLILASAYLVLGKGVIAGAFRNIREGKFFDESFLMTVSGIGAFATGNFLEAGAVMFLYRLGEYLQEKAVGRSERQVMALLDIRPDTACVLKEGREEMVKAENVSIGEVIIVRPGERIPLDGVVLKGSASVELSALTGESVPKIYKEGDSVLSGGVNLNGVLKIGVEKAYSESTASKIIELAQSASERKAPQEKFITTFARYYTPLVVVFAVLLAVIPPIFWGAWQEWLKRSLVFLVISCPCALVISVPLAYFVSIGISSSKGILIKGGSYLDALTRLDTVVFDKTGTLTEGKFKVAEIIPTNGFNEEEVLEYAAKAEFFSNHPIAVSIKEKYGKEIDSSLLYDYSEIPGKGVKIKAGNKEVIAGNKSIMEETGIKACFAAENKTAVYVAINGVYAGALLISDYIKNDTKQGLTELRNEGIRKTVVLTGDNLKTAEMVSKNLKFDEFHSNLLPEDKLRFIDKIKKEVPKNKKVAFVGDGINDAPVLAGADIGISMGALGSDAAIEASDIVLMTDEISKVAEVLKIAKKTRKIVIQNIVFSIGIKLVFLALGAIGEASMWQAVIADVGVMILAVLNSLRILRL